MIQKHQTACCALCQITASNEDSFKDLKDMVDKIKMEAKYAWAPEDRSAGERCIFVITTEKELHLEDNLRELCFDRVKPFRRRNGYKPGALTMWTLSF